MLAGLVLVPLPRFFDERRRQWGLLAALLVVLLLTDRPDAALHDPARLFALLLVVLAVLVPAALLLARGRGASRGIVAGGFAALALAVVAIGYPVQRHYLDERFRNEVAAESIPGMHLDSAYRWARGLEDARIGLAGTTAGFAQYGFYGTDLSNRVVYLGEDGPARRLQRDPDLLAASAPPSTPPTSTTSSPRPSSTSSTPATRSPRPRRAGCAASPPSRRSSAAARSPSGRFAASSTRPPAAPQRPAARNPRHLSDWVISAPVSYPLENALFQWEEGYRELQALSDPRARRLADRVVEAIRDELRRRIGADLHRRRAGRPLRARHRLVPADRDRRRTGGRGRRAVAGRRGLLAVPARRRRLRRRPPAASI